MSSEVEYVFETARGVVVRTFGAKALAQRWARKHARTYPGGGLFEVETVVSVNRTRVPLRNRKADPAPAVAAVEAGPHLRIVR